MRTLVAVAASLVLSTGALACEIDAAAQSAPDPSVAAKKDSVAPVVASQATTKPTTKTRASAQPKKDAPLSASVAPKPADFSQRAGS